MKYFPNRKSQPNYKQNQRLRIQKTLNRFKNQFSDRKHFPKSGKKFQRQHQNNAARVCNRLRVLTQNQVGVSYWFCEHGSLIGLVFNQSSFIWNPDKQTSILWITAGIWNRMREHAYMKIFQYTVVCETLADQTLAGFRIFLEIFKNTIIYLVKNVGIFFKVTGSFVFFLKTGKRYRPNSFCIVNYGSHSTANFCWTNPFSTSG